MEGENQIKSYQAMNTANKSLVKVDYLRLIGGMIRMDFSITHHHTSSHIILLGDGKAIGR